jgi:dephospho-CoA kinase
MIIAVTGAMAAGKSTVAQLIAERLPRAVHVRGDVFRRMIVSGRFEIARLDEARVRG